ncbi:hypothetical protein V1512DRAFT_268378 [Lipomyces arxii]|uniref:uncharacterized protein n=1 Tax=Lipomyces arxii TaxID=56418 RepID=UPI0034CD9F98
MDDPRDGEDRPLSWRHPSSSPLELTKTNGSLDRISLLSSSPLRRTRPTRKSAPDSSPPSEVIRTLSSETVTAPGDELWLAIEDLRQRVSVLEVRGKRPVDAHLRAALAQTKDKVSSEAFDALEAATVAVELVVESVKIDRTRVKAKTDAVYRSLNELLIVLADERPQTAFQITPSSPGSIADRLPSRAASRMQRSLETSQLPPEFRPASRLASRPVSRLTSRIGDRSESNELDDVARRRVYGSRTSIYGVPRTGIGGGRPVWSSPPLSRYGRERDY